jgi:hypothetical protein
MVRAIGPTTTTSQPITQDEFLNRVDAIERPNNSKAPSASQLNFRDLLLEGFDIANSDLSHADFTNTEFRNCCFRAVRFEGAIFRHTKWRQARLEEVWLNYADFRRSDMDEVTISGARCFHADLRCCALKGVTIDKAYGLLHSQLAGSNLATATVPIQLEDPKTATTAVSVFARRVLLAMVGAVCVFWVGMLLGNGWNDGGPGPAFVLPLVGLTVPKQLFFLVGPIVLVALQVYFHVYLGELWEILGRLPAVEVGGTRLDNKMYPWLFSVVVGSHSPVLSDLRLKTSRARLALAVGLGYLMAPATLMAFLYVSYGAGLPICYIVAASCLTILAVHTLCSWLLMNVALGCKRPLTS